MYKLLIFILLIPLNSLFGQDGKEIQSKYPKYVGDIEFDEKTDRKDFELNLEKRIYQYFNHFDNGLEYEGEKLAIEKEFAAKYKPEKIENETGLIRINFVVNYKGETDRFRLIAMDENYNEKVFPQSVTSQLMDITKGLKGWKIQRSKDAEVDYYQYLIFKIQDGQLIEILP
ncbi:hypothetical protein M2451_002767 [Dysgonomonas sp. PFB1-18]|uniref:hypothetical protein n=1 Tax=unclassified Dysgonomonas TaxID=2630389 RepID=UPI002475C23A|nr:MULTISPECIES: hypothetical protein [unclassified Dysgonomonas]MDH6309347.1 hypothetical protein [Dysgonomonas sp. PF1-14]MDH6339788.1 hypothetical protein [Dysgonomonas sp. PF1-16]MDH6381436.1 hypothetical protein [Dysgonomonas sp. PFB1-18]MDH6398651.1 hypothetical protein [Dysgonomonas sp. PF1-23]